MTSSSRNWRQYSLQGLLLLPMLFSPLFLSIVIASDVIAKREPRMSLGVIPYAAIYSLVFTLHGWIGARKTRPHPQRGPYLALLARGTLWGGIVGLMLFIPFFTVQAVVDYWKMSIGNAVGSLLAFVCCVATFALIGSACGGVVGLFVRR